MQAPASRARTVALILSGVAVLFAFGFAIVVRRWWAVARVEGLASTFTGESEVTLTLLLALTLLLIAMLLRMGAAICELMWLERAISNLPIDLRRVGPIENVGPVHVFGIAFIPVVSWFWKLGMVASVSNGLEKLRLSTPFTARVPKHLGMTAVVLGWLPPLNIYLAPFLWEMYARRIDVVCVQLAAFEDSPQCAAAPEEM